MHIYTPLITSIVLLLFLFISKVSKDTPFFYRSVVFFFVVFHLFSLISFPAQFIFFRIYMYYNMSQPQTTSVLLNEL